MALLVVACGGGGKVKHADVKRDGPVVMLGDSLGAGYEVRADEGFVALLEKRLGIKITNLSKNGITTEASLPRIKDEVIPLKPALVMIELGGNDALQRVEPAKTEANLARMIEELQAEGIPVILLGVRGGVFSDGFEGMYEDLSARYGTGYVPDILDGIFTHPELKIDSIHPNAKGYVKVADLVEPELRRVWEAVGGGQ